MRRDILEFIDGDGAQAGANILYIHASLTNSEGGRQVVHGLGMEMGSLQSGGIDVFAADYSKIYRLMVLWADLWRTQVV